VFICVHQRSSRAFSLIELIVVVAVLASIAAVIAWRTYGVVDASAIVSEKRSIQLWNTSYQSVVSSGYVEDGIPFGDLDWTHASTDLSAGVWIQSGEASMFIQVDLPDFRYNGLPDFTPGKGIVAPPSGP
jgi:prepilin-type N-terminal cleavage/methylation domain-containing protein